MNFSHTLFLHWSVSAFVCVYVYVLRLPNILYYILALFFHFVFNAMSMLYSFSPWAQYAIYGVVYLFEKKHSTAHKRFSFIHDRDEFSLKQKSNNNNSSKVQHDMKCAHQVNIYVKNVDISFDSIVYSLATWSVLSNTHTCSAKLVWVGTLDRIVRTSYT